MSTPPSMLSLKGEDQGHLYIIEALDSVYPMMAKYCVPPSCVCVCSFNPYEEQSIKRFTHRGKWAYNHMIRFWFKDVFELPALADVKYLMRLDVDSRLSAPWQQNVFEVMDKQEAVYWANQVIYDVEWVTPGQTQAPRRHTNTIKLSPCPTRGLARRPVPRYVDLYTDVLIFTCISKCGYLVTSRPL